MSDQNPSEAKINIDETIPKLEEMQNALSMALEGMQNESKNKLSGLVKKATGLAIRISKKQEEMNELISGRKQLFENRTIYPENDPILELLGGQQLEINEAVDKLTEIVVELSSSTFLISPYTVSLCSIIKKRLVECSKALSEKNTPIAGKISNDSLLLINLLIAQLLETMDNMNQNSGSGMGFEEMMENLKKMTQQQGQMSQMTQQMMQQLSQNGSLSEFQQEMLKQMQAQQNMMRQAMEEMANSSIDDQLGKKLKEIAKEMKESDSLYKPESLKRLEKQQRKIQERMLDAQKSLHKEKESPKRLARTANEKDFKRSAPAREIEKFNTLREKSRIESENIEKSIPAYQKIIKEYFHRLSKSGE
jgi:predicted transcriptional regulator